MLRQNRHSCQSSCVIDLRNDAKQMELLNKVEVSKGKKRGSKRDPEANKQLLIEATLDTIADIGVTDTSVSRICERSGLSRGMIHLHFGGKDNLLTAAARHFSAQYYAEMDRMTDLGSDASPEDRVMAVIEADLSEALLNPRSTKIWHAFRGIASSHPGIARYSSTQDHKLVETLRLAFKEITQENGCDPNLADDATSGTLALLEGMWVNYLTDMQGFSRRRSVDLIRRFLCGLFPGRFKL